MKKLSKEEMKNVMGGVNEFTEKSSEDGNEWKCCWKSDPSNCSVCVVNGSSCVPSAVLTRC